MEIENITIKHGSLSKKSIKGDKNKDKKEGGLIKTKKPEQHEEARWANGYFPCHMKNTRVHEI